MIGLETRARHGAFVLVRRLRRPLVALVLVYAVAVLGFTLVPGQDPDGNPWHMGFFHAFYFVSFLGTTIGLGEVPYPFSDAQRLWATISIYTTVVAWLYAIGSLFSLLQDPVFRRLMHENSVQSAVRKLHEHFYLVCGYDDGGRLVVRELAEEGIASVVVDRIKDRVDSIDVAELRLHVPALHGDATEPVTLARAGLGNPLCRGVLALTGDDMVNLKIAMSSKLLRPDVQVICSAREHQTHPHMAAAGVEHIINPNDTAARRLSNAIRLPSLNAIYECLAAHSRAPTDALTTFPDGKWIVCGEGGFVRTFDRHLRRNGMQTELITTDEGTAPQPEESLWLNQKLDTVDMSQAVGVIIGTDSDLDNLMATRWVRARNRDAFIVVKQNQRRNSKLFRAVDAGLVVFPGYIVATEVMRNIRAPQLSYFLRLARDQDEAWAARLLEKMREDIGDQQAAVWSVAVEADVATSLHAAISAGKQARLADLLRAPDNRDLPLRALCLLLQRGKDKQLLPEPDSILEAGDQLLFCGRDIAESRMKWTLEDPSVMDYLIAGTPC
ncbi:MAG: NAD-binding protein [Pseudoxanthomonas sp.]